MPDPQGLPGWQTRAEVAALFPPTERERALIEVRQALLAECAKTTVEPTPEHPIPGFLWTTEIIAILDRVARTDVARG